MDWKFMKKEAKLNNLTVWVKFHSFLSSRIGEFQGACAEEVISLL